MSVFETMDVKDCTACGCLHRLVHILVSDGARWYYCPRTEQKVLVALVPLEPA